MICLTVGLGGSGGPSSATGLFEGPPFFFLSVVNMSRSSSGTAGFLPEAFEDEPEAFDDAPEAFDEDAGAFDDDAPGAGVLLPPFPFFAI